MFEELIYSLSPFRKNRLIYTDFFRDIIQKEPIVVADIGARGDVQQPWLSINKDAIKFICFEPDLEEYKRLISLEVPNRIYYPYALWSYEDSINFSLAQDPSTSSVHPPNFKILRKYRECHWKPRLPLTTVSVNCTTLDKVLENGGIDCDFLKLDTQGGEYEILQGAMQSLQDKIFGVLAETWTTEIHQSQRLAGEVLKFMSDMGFRLFDIRVIGNWHRQTSEDFRLNSKGQVVPLNFLFFREPALWSERVNQPLKVIKAAAITEAFGFPDYSIALLEEHLSLNPDHAELFRQARDTIIKNSRISGRLIQHIRNILHKIQIVLEVLEYPSLR